MQKIQQWSSEFDYTDLDRVIAHLKACNALEQSRTVPPAQHGRGDE